MLTPTGGIAGAAPNGYGLTPNARFRRAPLVVGPVYDLSTHNSDAPEEGAVTDDSRGVRIVARRLTANSSKHIF